MKQNQHHGASTDQQDQASQGYATARADPDRPSWLDYALIALFLLALVLPAVLLRPDPEAAAAEKRSLAPAPVLPRSLDDLVTFPRSFDAWFADHFGFRQALIKAHSRVSFFVLRTSPSPKIILGKNGWLFYDGKAARDGDTIADFRGVPPLSFAALERWRWAFQNQHDWLHARGIHHLIALVPAKETIYPDYMPDHITRLAPPAIEQVAAYLRATTTIPIIDTTPDLREARARVLTYHPNDTHWNAFGAYIGYRAIMNKVAEIFPAAAPRREEEFKREELDGDGGDLAVMIHIGDRHPQHYVFMNPLFTRVATTQKLGDDEMSDLITATGNTNLPRAAILRDSFTEAMLPYLAEHFDRAHFQWARTGFESSLLQRVDPEIVIQIIADRAFRKFRRYPVMMHHESIARRFASPEALPLATPPLTGVAGTEIEPTALHHASAPPRTEFAAPGSIATNLAIVQFTVVSDLHRDITATWTCHEPDERGSLNRRAPPVTLTPGTNVFHLALIDPDIVSPIHLQWGRHPGRIAVRTIEIRGIPR